MSTYIVGDVQGCFAELLALLNMVNFDVECDRIAFVGDLVNRGPDSLNTLRFIKSLPNATIVLGNHDIALLALACCNIDIGKKHTLAAVLAAPDCQELVEWLAQQPLLYADLKQNYVLVHAGIPPQWNVAQALTYAHEVEAVLRDKQQRQYFLSKLYGAVSTVKVLQWSEELQGIPRWYYILGSLTCMRFCDAYGQLYLQYKTARAPEELKPWFYWYQHAPSILFGHWAALEGYSQHPRCLALDTGCVWGGGLTAYRLEDGRRFYMPAIELRSKINVSKE